jgi:hypothetical protein
MNEKEEETAQELIDYLMSFKEMGLSYEDIWRKIPVGRLEVLRRVKKRMEDEAKKLAERNANKQ